MMQMRQPGQNPTIETRHDSHEEVLHSKQKRYTQIIEILREKGDLTAKECAVAMFEKGYVSNTERNNAAPRLNELSNMGILEPVGKKKCAWTGKTVAVYGFRRN